jgi:hypothetical protein
MLLSIKLIMKTKTIQTSTPSAPKYYALLSTHSLTTPLTLSVTRSSILTRESNYSLDDISINENKLMYLYYSDKHNVESTTRATEVRVAARWSESYEAGQFPQKNLFILINYYYLIIYFLFSVAAETNLPVPEWHLGEI